MPKQIDWRPIEEAYLAGTDSLAEIAMRFGVSKRAVEDHAAENSWAARRRAQISEKPKPQPRETSPPPPVRSKSSEIDELTIIETAIADLSTALASKDTDSRSLGGIASALVRLLEYRRKLRPPTAADLAEMVVQLGISPAEFVRELKERWAESA